MRDVPRNLDDKKDVESWFRALRDRVVRIFKHSELDDIRGADKDSTDTTKDKHVSNYDLKKIEDHMDDTSKHIGSTLSNTANYISNVSAASNKIAIASPTASTRTIDVVPGQIDHAELKADSIGVNSHSQIDSHLSSNHVNQFNGRTGTVTPATNDYTWAQINKATSDIADITTKSHTSLSDVGSNNHAAIDTHVASTANPHGTSDANLSTSDITTNNVSTTKHGFCPKLPNDSAKFLNGVGSYAVPSGTSYTGGRNINITGTVISLEMQSGCDVDRSTTQSINSGGTTVIQYNNENYDYGSEYDTSTYKFTATLGGRYMVTVAVGLTGITTNKLVEVLIKKNGAEVAQNGTRSGDSGGGSSDVRLQVTRFVSLAIGDYIEGAVYHEHGSARNTIAETDTTYMSIAFIG